MSERKKATGHVVVQHSLVDSHARGAVVAVDDLFGNQGYPQKPEGGADIAPDARERFLERLHRIGAVRPATDEEVRLGFAEVAPGHAPNLLTEVHADELARRDAELERLRSQLAGAADRLESHRRLAGQMPSGPMSATASFLGDVDAEDRKRLLKEQEEANAHQRERIEALERELADARLRLAEHQQAPTPEAAHDAFAEGQEQAAQAAAGEKPGKGKKGKAD